jgi:HD-like signal output (HDOD) protein
MTTEPLPITRDRVGGSTDGLPSFPSIVLKILETLDDPDANLRLLVDYIEHDAVIASRVLSVANRADSSHVGSKVSDIFAATALIGLRRVREVVIVATLVDFMKDIAPDSMPASLLEYFWRDSVVTAVCCVEVARETALDVSLELALITGLMHNIGQLWLERFEPARFESVMRTSQDKHLTMSVAEVDMFGVDHATVGAWMSESWGLTESITLAIGHHHRPGDFAREPLVAVVHVGENLGNALDLAHSPHSAVAWISADCCDLLGMDWTETAHDLFGRIEARAQHALVMLQ